MLTIEQHRIAEHRELAAVIARSIAKAGSCDLESESGTDDHARVVTELGRIRLSEIEDLETQVLAAYELGRAPACRAATLRLQAAWAARDVLLLPDDASELSPIGLGVLSANGTLECFADDAVTDVLAFDPAWQRAMLWPVGSVIDVRAGDLDNCVGTYQVLAETTPGTVIADQTDRARLALRFGFEALGACAAALQSAIDYAGLRTQFGVPIGAHQSLAHRLSRVHLSLEACAASGVEATARHGSSSALSAGADAVRATREFVALVTECLPDAAEQAMHSHGAIGFCWEHPAHRWLRRVWSCVEVLHWTGLADPMPLGAAMVDALANSVIPDATLASLAEE
jgi:hypothetical protein